jgi:hypothetical protein
VYSDPDQHSYLYASHAGGRGQVVLKNAAGTVQIGTAATYYRGALDFQSNQLIVGETGTSGSDLQLFTRDVVTGDYVAGGTIAGISYPKADFIRNGNDLYYGDGKYGITDSAIFPQKSLPTISTKLRRKCWPYPAIP